MFVGPSCQNAHFAGGGSFVCKADVSNRRPELKWGVKLDEGDVVLGEAPTSLGQRMRQDLKDRADLRVVAVASGRTAERHPLTRVHVTAKEQESHD